MTSARDEIRAVVVERARRDSLDQVASLRSDGHAEQTVRSEYHGRFLIELLQNARDAAMKAAAHDTGGRSWGRLRIELEPGSLVVANQGVPVTPKVLLYSLGKFGESTKPHGEGIGHKGIGFKSVLEVSLTPELYSREAVDGPFDLAVRFDPEAAVRLVRERSANFQALAAELPADSVDDPVAMIPVLAFPQWVDEPTSECPGFNTVVRLVHEPRFDPLLKLDADEWQRRARSAVDALSDQIVVLLAVFDRIEIAVQGEPERVIERRILDEQGSELRVTDIEVARDGVRSTRWRLFERSLEGQEGLTGDLAVGVRLVEQEGRLRPAHPWVGERDESGGGCFHLFFPTEIPTHLPFLLHAYFEVNASRTRFARDAEARNRALLLDGLEALVADAVVVLVADAEVDPVPLAGLFAETDGPLGDGLADEFRRRVLDRLDALAWVSANGSNGSATLVAPVDLLVDVREQVAAALPVAFPSAYLERLGETRRHPHRSIGSAGLGFLARRANPAGDGAGEVTSPAEAGRVPGEVLERLLRPGPVPLWDAGREATGFVALLRLLGFLLATDPGATHALVDGLRGDEAARIIPVVGADGPRYVSPPALAAEEQGAAGAVFARLRSRDGSDLAPPAGLGLEFVPDGVLDRELMASPGARLGIREYTTKAVLDRLAASSPERLQSDEEATATAVFVWRLLARERDSAFGLRQTLFDAVEAAPGAWFWCEPGRARSDEKRADQRRARALAHLLLPAADRTWRPATALAFGPAWADWFEAQPGDRATARAQRYRRLGAVAPSPSDLVAGPDELVQLLALEPTDLGWLVEDDAPPLGDEPLAPAELASARTHRALLHTFLLRLGVWEIPPVEAIVDYRSRASADVDPWPDGLERVEQLAVDGWTFGVKYPHDKPRVHVAEDYRWRWPLDVTGDVDHLSALADGAAFYQRFGRLRRFCPGCSNNHKNTYHDDDVRVPSTLAWQVQRIAWVPVIRHGEPAGRCRPTQAWWRPDPPQGKAAERSPYRYLALAAGEVLEPLRRLAGIPDVDDADADRLLELLDDLRELLESGDSPGPADGPAVRQTFVGLHGRVYRRLVALDAPVPVEVLAEDGTALVHAPPSACRFDDGRHAGHRRHFVGRLAFAALGRDQNDVAVRFDIPRFRLEITRRPGGDERDDTDAVRPLLHDRADEIMAVLVFHALGGPTLDLGSESFRERATRLTQLQVRHVDDLVLDLTVVGTEPAVVVAVGEGSERDLHVDGATTAHPVLFHDLRGPDWLDQLRRHVAPHLADLVENAAYAATIALLLQHDDPDERQAWLLDLGIGDAELDQVRDALATCGLVARDEHRRWWQALLPLLGVDVDLPDGEDPTAAATAGLAGAAVDSDLQASLLAAGGGSDVRRDTRPDGVLAALEDGGVDLAELDRRLRSLGDAGLRVDRAAALLRDWAARYGRRVAALLVHGPEPLSREDARERPRRWQLPEQTRWRIRPALAEVLAPVVADLAAVIGIDPDVGQLAGPDTGDYLAELGRGIGIDDLGVAVDELYAGDDGERQRREAALAWRSALIPRLTALTVADNEPPYAVRATAETVAAALAANPAVPADLEEGITSLAGDHEDLVEALELRLDGHDHRLLPVADELDELFARYVDEVHLRRVVEILARGPRRRVDALRTRTARLAERQVAPVPLEPEPQPGSGPESGHRVPEPGPRPKPTVKPVHVTRDPRRLKQIGDEGEAWALAAVMAPLLAMEADVLEHSLTELSSALGEAYAGACIEELQATAVRAGSPALDDDERVEALAEFLHLSRTSDMFGCDVLGWLPARVGEDPAPLFLEVKSSRGREVLISSHEWDEAARLGHRYAVLVVTRDHAGEPTGMELLVDPVALASEHRLTLTPDGYHLAYGASGTS